MKKVGLILIMVVIAGLGGYFLLTAASSNEPESSPEPASDTSLQSSQSGSQPSRSQAGDGPDEPAASYQIDIANMAYQPGNITVKRGATVTWTNRDDIQHDITPDEESQAFTGSQLLAKGESYSFTFDTPGAYAYHCSPHPQMTGMVTVTE